MPDRLAALRIERNERGRELVLLRRAVAAPVIDGAVAHGQVDQPELFVRRGDRPHVRSAARVGLRAVRVVSGGGYAEVPGPGQLARLDVERLDHARGGIVALPVEHLVPRHDHVAHDDRRGGDGNHSGDHPPHAVGDVDRAVGAEARARPSGAGVDRYDARVERPLDDARRAGLGRVGALRGVVGDAPAGGGVGNPVRRDLRVVAPALLPGGRIERDQDVHGRAEIKGVADLEGGGFGAVFVVFQVIRQVARVCDPGALESADVLGRDLG